MLTIKPATEADIPVIQAIAQQTFPQTYKDIITPEQCDYMMNWMYSTDSLHQQMQDGHHYMLALDGGQPIGYVSVERQADTLFHLQKIYVLQSARGTGAGRFLFQAAIDHIRTVCPTPCRMELNVNRYNRALGFYERMGMRRDREGDFPIGNGYFMNDYIMVLDIV